MTKTTQYVQCTLKRVTRAGVAWTTTFIPRQFAILGRCLKLRDESDQGVDGWIVTSADSIQVDGADAPDYRKAIRLHRKSTGDSQPRNRG